MNTNHCDKCKSHNLTNTIAVDELVNQHNEINPSIVKYLTQTNFKHLCTNCIKEIQNYSNLALQYPFPNSPKDYVENIHYYLEGNFWVFTSFYHYLKGSCCKNNCRHCAYGFQNK